MSRLQEKKLVNVIKEQACSGSGKPILGICLGMQLMGRKSDEGSILGLGLIPFECIHFRLDGTNVKVMHRGWDIVELKNPIR